MLDVLGSRGAFVGLALILAAIGATAYLPVWFPDLAPELPLGSLAAVPPLAFVCALAVNAFLGPILIFVARSARHMHLTATHDPMTGCANLRNFESRLDTLLAHRLPSHALLMLDLDHFKPVNDTYGHAAGDQLLCEVSAGLRSLCRPTDMVARLGGDEFAILIVDADAGQREALAIEALEFVRQYQLKLPGNPTGIKISASIGLVSIDRPGLSAKIVRKAGDDASYAAKHAGRDALFELPGYAPAATTTEPRRVDRVIELLADPGEAPASAFEEEPETDETSLLRLSGAPMVVTDRQQDSRRSLPRHEPVRDATGAPRWVSLHPRLVTGTRGAEALDTAELLASAADRPDAGLSILRWALAMTISASTRLGPSRSRQVGLVLPISAHTITAVANLGNMIAEPLALAGNSRPPHLTLVLHGIESAYPHPALEPFISRLKVAGVRIGVELVEDSIGVLEMLPQLGMDELHFGPRLTRSIGSGSRARATIRTLVAFAQHNDWITVATRVETEASLRHLVALGVERLAGPAVATETALDPLLLNLTLDAAQGDGNGTQAA